MELETVIFPEMIVPLTVGRQKSVDALNAAVAADSLIVLVTQREAEREDIVDPAELYTIGTLAKIAQVVSLQDGTVRAIVQGQRRIRLLEAIDAMRGHLVTAAIANAKASGNPIVMIPIHWAPDAFMSPKQFETFWWPSFRQMMLDLIAADLIPMPLWESDCTKRLEIIKDIPPGKCIYWFERTDLVKAFEVLGDRVALRGNLSPSMMSTGTPQDVDAAVKHLVDKVWNRGGNLILEHAFGTPDETPVENVRAMFRAARHYAG